MSFCSKFFFPSHGPALLSTEDCEVEGEAKEDGASTLRGRTCDGPKCGQLHFLSQSTRVQLCWHTQALALASLNSAPTIRERVLSGYVHGCKLNTLLLSPFWLPKSVQLPSVKPKTARARMRDLRKHMCNLQWSGTNIKKTTRTKHTFQAKNNYRKPESFEWLIVVDSHGQ